jgi:hypothetical protein
VAGAIVEEVDSLSLPESPSSENSSSCFSSCTVLRVDEEEASGCGVLDVEDGGSAVNLVNSFWACWTTSPKSFLAL